MKTYFVPIKFTVWGTVEVEAGSIEEAEELALEEVDQEKLDAIVIEEADWIVEAYGETTEV